MHAVCTLSENSGLKRRAGDSKSPKTARNNQKCCIFLESDKFRDKHIAHVAINQINI